MTQADFIEAVYAELGPDTKVAKSVVKTVLDAAENAGLQLLQEKGGIRLFGLGSLKSVKRAARKGRNPRTGKEIDIPAKNAVKYTPSKAVKTALN